MLQEKFAFTHSQFASLDEYMQWFGSTHNVVLPWENPEERKTIISEKAALLTGKIEEAKEEYKEKAKVSLEDIHKIISDAEATSDVEDLKELENILSDAIVSHNEEYFIRVSSKTEDERNHILEKFDDIQANEDMSALWLEVNTWKSLISISGDQIVKRNFKIEDDLTPKSLTHGRSRLTPRVPTGALPS